MKSDTCHRVRDAIRSGEDPASEHLAAHARGCPDCADRLQSARLLSDVGLPPVPDDVPHAPQGRQGGLADAGWARLQASLARSRSPLGRLRRLGRGWRVAGLLLFAMALAGAQLLNPRADLQAYPIGRMILAILALSAVALLGWLVALRPLQRSAPSTAGRFTLMAGLVLVPALLAAAPEAHTAHPASAGGVGAELVPQAVACFLYGGAFGLPLALLALAADRTGGRRPLPWLVAFAAGAVGGNLVLQLHCPLTHPAHLLAGHASIGLASVALAATQRGRT